MERFTAKGALLTGVDLIRRRPWLVVLWAVLLLALTIVWLAGQREVQASISSTIIERPSRYSIGPLLAYTLTGTLLQLFLTAVIWASAFRAILRPAERGPLRLGGEELCVTGALLVPLLVGLVVSFPLSVLMVRTHALTGGWLTIRAPTLIIDVLTLFWGAVGAVWAFERLEVAPFRCWRIARGRFWLLAGLAIGVAVLQHLAVAGVQHLANVMALRQTPDFSNVLPTRAAMEAALQPRPNLGRLFEAPALVRDVLAAVIKALEIAVVAGIVASAYSAGAPEPQAASVSASGVGSVAEPS